MPVIMTANYRKPDCIVDRPQPSRDQLLASVANPYYCIWLLQFKPSYGTLSSDDAGERARMTAACRASRANLRYCALPFRAPWLPATGVHKTQRGRRTERARARGVGNRGECRTKLRDGARTWCAGQRGQFWGRTWLGRRHWHGREPPASIALWRVSQAAAAGATGAAHHGVRNV